MWWLRIIALNAVAGAVELLFAVEGAYFVPAIYDKGLSPVYGSIILCLGPLLGVLFQSYLGCASDECKSRFGKRRPFILALTIAAVSGLILFSFTRDIADLLKGDLEGSRYVVLLVLTALATGITNFSAASLFVPSKAYLLDVLPEELTKFGNIVCSVWMSLGAAVGFGIGVVTWSSNFNIQIQIVCGISVIIVVACTTVTLFSVNEQNPNLRASVKANPDQASAVVNEDRVEAIQETPVNKYQDDAVNASKPLEGKSMLPSIRSQDSHNEFYDRSVTDNNNNTYNTDNNQTECRCRCLNGLIDSILGNLQFIRHMSFAMIILCSAMFFGFLAFTTELFFFTDYIAEVVYDGDVTAPEDSPEYDDYTKGVRIGSLALGISATTSLVFSFITLPLMKLLGMRLILVFSLLVAMLQSGVLIVCHNIIVVFAILPALYFMSTVILVIPFILVSEYEATALLLRKSYSYGDSNLIGRACSVIMISMLCADVVALMINGPLKDLYGGAESVMIVTCISCFIGAVITCFVKVPSEDSKRTTEGTDKSKKVAEATESTKLLIN